MKEEKSKALKAARSQIEHQFGKGAIMRLGEKGPRTDIDTIPTGSLSLDAALGIGGLPRGRIVEIFGSEGSGKTTLALHAAAEAQKKGGVVAFVDAEHALDPTYTEKLGVDVDNIFLSQPDSGEDALEITETLVRSNAIDLLVIDSVAALVPRAEIEGEMGDAQVGLQARLMSQALRKLASAINRSKTCTIFVNQLRMKVGTMFGNPETTPGGRALKFHSSVRISIRRRSSLKTKGEQIGNRIKVNVVKNKLAPPFRKAEFDMIFGEGISKEADLLDLGEETGIVKKSGSWYSFQGTQLGQGKERAREFLKNPENKPIREQIEKRIKDKVGLPGPEGKDAKKVE